MAMTPEEALAMLGTEFIYEYLDGDTIPAYVKKIDLEAGKMSCFSLEDHTERGYVSDAPDKVDGTWCVISARAIPGIFRHLEIIRDTGRYKAGQALSSSGSLTSGFSCVFSE